MWPFHELTIRGRPFCFLALTVSILFWALGAVVVDTAYYSGPRATKSFSGLYDTVRNTPIITPYNNLMYNTQTSNLAEHGIHPHYQHIIANAPQLLGPALVLLLISAWPFNLRTVKNIFNNNRLASAATGTLSLSLIPHQEPRFLLPIVPLVLTSIRVPASKFANRLFWASWFIFNSLLAILMGVYHQGGIIPTQLSMPSLITKSINNTHSQAHNIEVFWWKTYPPPTFLLGAESKHTTTNRPLNISSVPLMGFPQNELVFMLMQHMPTCDPSLLERLFLHKEKTDIFVVAPVAAWRLAPPDQPDWTYTYPPLSNFSFAIDMTQPPAQLQMTNLATYRKHINLDDMGFGDDGVWPTLQRVVGRRGLGVWKVDRMCGKVEYIDTYAEMDKVAQQEHKARAEAEASTQIATYSTTPLSSTTASGTNEIPTMKAAIDPTISNEAEGAKEGAPVDVDLASKSASRAPDTSIAASAEPTPRDVFSEQETRIQVSTTTIPANFSAEEVHVAE
jgi:GPI mannosyltransferase 4